MEGQGQALFQSPLQLCGVGVVGVQLGLAAFVHSVLEGLHQGKAAFASCIGGRDIPFGQALAAAGQLLAQGPSSLPDGLGSRGLKDLVALGQDLCLVGHRAAAQGGGGLKGDLQLCSTIVLRDGIAVFLEFLCRYRIVAYLYIPYDFHTLRQAIRDPAALQEIGPQKRMGYFYGDGPLDAACFGVVLAVLLNARGFTGVPCFSLFLLAPCLRCCRIEDGTDAVGHFVKVRIVPLNVIVPDVLFFDSQCFQVLNDHLGVAVAVLLDRAGERQDLRLCTRCIHLVKFKGAFQVLAALQVIASTDAPLIRVQGIRKGHRVFGTVGGLHRHHIMVYEGATFRMILKGTPIGSVPFTDLYIRRFLLDGQGVALFKGDGFVILKIICPYFPGELEGSGKLQVAVGIQTGELHTFVKGQLCQAVGVDGIGANDLVVVGLVQDLAGGGLLGLHGIRQLVAQGPPVRLQGARRQLVGHGDLHVGTAFHFIPHQGLPGAIDLLLELRFGDPAGVQIHLRTGSFCQQSRGIGVLLPGLADPFHRSPKAILIFQQRIAAVQLLLGACRVLRGHSGGLGGIGAGHRDDTGHVGHGNGHLGHLAVHVAGDHGQGPGVGVHGGHDAHRLGGHGAGVHLRLGSRELGGGVGVLVQVQQGDAIGALVHGHLLGGEGVVDDDIAGPCGGAVGVGEPLGAAQVTVQGHHARTLGHHRLGHTRKVQAVGQEHHVPGTVGVAVPGTIAGVAAQHLLVLHIQLEVLVALLVVQLGLCHGEQVLGPVAVQGHVGRGLPFLGSLHVGLGIGQALHGVVVLRDGAHQLLGVAGVGVVMQHRLVRGGLGRLRGQVHHGAAGRHFLIGGVGLLHQFALVQAAHQLILGGVAAVVVDMLELAADERTVLVKAVVGVLVLFLIAGQHPVLLVAGIGVLMGHPDGLRLGLHRLFRLFRLGRAVGGHQIGAAVRRGDGRFRLALLVTAGEHFFVAGRRVLVLLVAAMVVGSHGDAHPMELPVDEQGGEQGQHQHHGHIAPGLYMLPAEPLDQPVDDILHSKHVLLVRSVPWQPHTTAGPQKGQFLVCATKASQNCSIHCHYTILRRSFQLRGVLFRQKNAHDAHHARGQGQPQHRAAQIEQGVGVGDLPGQHGALRPVGRDQPHQRGELGQQQPAHRCPGQVEQRMGRRQTFGVPALPHRCQHRRDGGADVVPQQHRDGSRKAQQAPAVRPGAGGRLLQHRNGGGAALHGKGHAQPCQQAQAGAVPHLGHPLPEHRPCCQRLHGLGHDRDALKQQAERKQRLPGCVQTPAPREPEQQPRHQQQIPGIPQPEGQQLRGDRGADVGPEHHRHGPLQGQQPGPHKAQHQHRDRRAALHHRRDRRPREHPGQRVGREPGKGLPQGVPRRLLQSVREGVHTV